MFRRCSKLVTLLTLAACLCTLVLLRQVLPYIVFSFSGADVSSGLVERKPDGAFDKDVPAPDLLVLESSGKESLLNMHNYLLPINYILAQTQMHSNESSDCAFVENRIRQGYSLRPYNILETGEMGWIENGIVYKPYSGRPIRDESKNFNNEHPSPHVPEFEAYVPFDKKNFFAASRSDADHEGRGNPQGQVLGRKKTILWFTKTRYTPPMPNPRTLRLCPDLPCVITTNRTYAATSSAMLFAAQLLEKQPPPRRPDQVFIFHNHETPYAVKFQSIDKESWRSAFNWTMTFRVDSDIPAFYGVVRKRPKPVYKDYAAILAKKTKTVAWISSHCNTLSRRDEYVKELQKYISVDIFGKCGTMACGNREQDDQCKKLVSENYKFYLSFENALCRDYVTEKLFKYMNLDVITVGRASNDYHLHVPSDIFVNAADYPTPKELAHRLNQLDSNNEEYSSMLRRKDEYMFVMEDHPIRSETGTINYMTYHFEETSLCHVCYRLWNMREFSSVVSDVFAWWDKGKCRNIQV